MIKKFFRNTMTCVIALSLIAGYTPALVLADDNETDEGIEETTIIEEAAEEQADLPADSDATEADIEYTGEADAVTYDNDQEESDPVLPFPEISYTEYSWEDGQLKATTKTTHGYTVVDENLNADGNGLAGGTYVVNRDVIVDNHIYICKGEPVNFILLDGYTLTCPKGIGCSYTSDGRYSTLNIYGTGKIVSKGRDKCAGIGGGDEGASGNINIHGATIVATGGKHAAGIGGGEGGQDPDGTTAIRIYAGNITATGGIDGAGIGGGDSQPGAHTYIYNSTVTASSTKHGAGIGGGDGEGTLGIEIHGSKVTATGGAHGAGIGAGEGSGTLNTIHISGGDITATGGSGAAGIGGGYDKESHGNIIIDGDNTNLTVYGGDCAAGIGAGENAGYFEGDMCNDLTIACGPSSEINIYGGSREKNGWGGAGIGGGKGGNLEGKVYINGGKIYIESGNGAAGIGGGREDSGNIGGEGGTVYLGGGDITIHVNCTQDADSVLNNEAIGAGANDLSSGTVYVTSDKNLTNKYMRVVYAPVDQLSHPGTPKTASAGDRSSKCHTTSNLEICECPLTDHTDHNGNSGLTYTINDNEFHTVKCKYCGYSHTEEHTPGTCVCGYDSVAHNVTLHGYNEVTVSVGHDKKFTLPYSQGEIITDNLIPVSYYRVTGWRSGDAQTGTDYEPGSDVTITSDMEFYLITQRLYTISLADNQYGQITSDLEYATAGETVTFRADPEPGYKVKTVTYQYITGHDGQGPVYSEPVEIPAVDGKYQLIMPDVDTSGILVSPVFEYMGSRLAGYKLSLDGDIGVNFYMELAQEVITHKYTAYMKFTIPDGASVTEEKVYVKDAKEVVEGKVYHVFKCKVSAKDMNSVIKAQLIDGEYQGPEYTFTVQTYAKYILDHQNDTDYAAASDLVKALLNYGAYSQLYFGNNTGNLANEILPVDAQKLPSDVEITHEDAKVIDLPDGVTFEGTSLTLMSELTLSLYFKNTSGTAVTFKLGDEEITPVDNSGYQQVKITGIKANELSSDYTLNVGSGSVRFSPMNYCKAVLSGDYSDSLKNIVKALYVYSQEADKYFG